MSSREEQKEQYRIMIDNDKEFVIDSIIEKNDELTRQDVKIEELEAEIERLNNKLKDIKSQLDYLETYSSKEDVFEDMKRRLDRIDKIIGSE